MRIRVIIEDDEGKVVYDEWTPFDPLKPYRQGYDGGDYPRPYVPVYPQPYIPTYPYPWQPIGPYYGDPPYWYWSTVTCSNGTTITIGPDGPTVTTDAMPTGGATE